MYRYMTEFFPTAKVEVAMDKKDVNKLRKKYKAEIPDVEGADAVTHPIVYDNELHIIVVVNTKYRDERLYCLMAHEAVHMACAYMEYVVREEELSEEFFAYTVQSMMAAVLECIEHKEKKKNKAKKE